MRKNMAVRPLMRSGEGPKPERIWKEDHIAAVMEGAKVLGQDMSCFPHRASVEALHDFCVDNGIHETTIAAGFSSVEADCIHSGLCSPGE